MGTANIRIIRGRTSLPVIFVEKMSPTGACRAGKRRSTLTMASARREEVEVARGGGGGALGAPSEDAGASRAHNAHTMAFRF